MHWIPGIERPNFTFYKIKFSLPSTISTSYIYAAVFLSILYIYAGGVYDLVEKPFARGAGPNGNPVLVWPDQDRQFLIEGIVAGIIMFMGAFGLFMLNQGTSDPHNPSRGTSLQVIGTIIIVVAFIILQSMFNIKTG